jgi:predicted SprT family Zn-dependent metalloprotease
MKIQRVKEIFQDLFPKKCRCGRNAVVINKTYKNEKIYMCSYCLRSIRFKEKEFFKSILPYGSNK